MSGSSVSVMTASYRETCY